MRYYIERIKQYLQNNSHILKTSLYVAGGLMMTLFLYVLLKIFFLDDSQLKKSTILAKINRETMIMCADETTPLGSFFDSDHMQYVNIDDVPIVLQDAIVAAEDKNFYRHHGIDILAITSAFFEGIAQGGFRRGGSTLTQQTVKNILGSWERSFTRKFNEMIAAIKLERIYSKKQILEFYLNQFHVAGNGQGIGIAARYYFNKEVQDLDLIESAFIAGSVKGPSKYNPFIKYTQADRDVANKNAFDRKNYVLQRMHDQGMLTKDDYVAAIKKPVPFNRGTFRSRQVAIIDSVRQDMDRPEILAALGIDHIDELKNLGLTVFTTLDCDLQKSAQHKMQRNLSRLETILHGFAVEDPSSFLRLRNAEPGQYQFAKVKSITTGKEPSIQLDYGYPQGELSYDALRLYAMWLDLADGRGVDYLIKSMLQKIKVGDVLYTEVMSYDTDKNFVTAELRKFPRINGGFMALDKGKVRAVVSGFDTLGYNRALQAKRSPGSVFKVVTYLAGLQLGWNALDRLDNQRQLFNYQDQFYYPRPDHPSPYPEVSMVWAGILSENLASVHLAANLLEKSSFNDFKRLLQFLGLGQQEGEDASAYQFRVSKEIGAANEMQGIMEYQLTKALKNVEADLVFGGNSRLYEQIKKMWWGRSYARELKNLYRNEENLPTEEVVDRIELLKNNLERYRLQAVQFKVDWQKIANVMKSNGPQAAMSSSETMAIIRRFKVLSGGGEKPALGYFYEPESDKAPPRVQALQPNKGRSLNVLDLESVWGGEGFFASSGIDSKTVLLEGLLPISSLEKIEQSVAQHVEEVQNNSDEFGLVRFFENKHFRIALGLYYLKKLCQAMGVSSELEPVLSFPLGSNVVSLAEVSKIYQTFTAGKTYRFYKDGSPNQISFIERVTDREGHVLYEPKVTETQLVHAEYVDQIKEILRRIVTHGTGRRARGELFIPFSSSAKEAVVRVPSFGKTGTTNDFTTSYFAGFVPYPIAVGAPLDPENSYVLSAYVGYDMNETMKNGRIRIYGGTGALPLWTDVAKDLLTIADYDKFLNAGTSAVQSGEWPLKFRSGTSPVNVDLPRGGIVGRDMSDSNEIYAVTHIEKEGEYYENEFALTAGVKAYLQLPISRSLLSGTSVYSQVGFFNSQGLNQIKEFEEYKIRLAASKKKSADEQLTGEGEATATPPLKSTDQNPDEDP